MVAAFRELTKRASKGDQVYIHYSGHGGRTKPTAYADRKGADAWDESLVRTTSPTRPPVTSSTWSSPRC